MTPLLEARGLTKHFAVGRSLIGRGGGVVRAVDDIAFTIEYNDGGYARVFGQKGYFFAYLNPRKTTLSKLITANVIAIQDMGIEDLEVTKPQAVQITGVKGAASLNFRGLLATQQGGSIPVEGFAYYFVREDGTGATAFGLYGKGALKPKSKLLNGYNTMLNTLIATL